ncbi:glycosyltransferase family 39 protein [Desulfuromonas acetoxidans]|uniref:glycosyltransferase family 39 protein n=1 Tax=Desulfuromonas acetoxidans TaxID=891 RepID=UPI00292CDA09|nr:glycosyltransferase family 39 protein [Desulfuromonas acetoxidans]
MIDFLSRHRALLLIMALSLGLKLLFLWQAEVVNPDSATYIAAAQKHAQGLYSEGLRYYQMPFYPLVLAGVHAVVPNWIYAGQLLTVVPLVLCLWPLYELTRRVFDQQVAVATSLLFAVLPAFNTTATSIKRDPLFMLFSLVAVLFMIIAYQDDRLRWWLWFSLFSVFSILTRVEGVMIPAIAVVFVPFFRPVGYSDRKTSLWRFFIMVGLVPLFLVVVMTGLKLAGIDTLSRLNEVAIWGRHLVSQRFFLEYQELMEKLKVFQETLPHADLHNNLIETVRHYAPLIYLLGLMEMLGKIIFPTSLLALWAKRWSTMKTETRGRWLLVAVCLATILLNLVFSVKRNFTTERYLWLAGVCLLPWVGSGIMTCWQRYQAKRMVLLLVFLLFIGAPLAKTLSVAAEKQDHSVVEAGRWLQRYDRDEKMVILYNDRRLPLYANRAEDVRWIRNLAWLKRHARKKKDVTLVALYVSNKKNEDTAIDGFEPLKIFAGHKKTVLLLQRKGSSDN